MSEPSRHPFAALMNKPPKPLRYPPYPKVWQRQPAKAIILIVTWFTVAVLLSWFGVCCVVIYKSGFGRHP